jgi:hypothetical protein
VSTNSAGVVFVSPRNTRVKLRALMRAPCEDFQRERRSKIPENAFLRLLDWRLPGHLGNKMRTELGLPARPLENITM